MSDSGSRPAGDESISFSGVHPTGAPPAGAVLDTPVVPTPTLPSDDGSTVGTGTSIALGCVVGTIVLIIFGLIFLGIVALVN